MAFFNPLRRGHVRPSSSFFNKLPAIHGPGPAARRRGKLARRRRFI